MGRWQQAEEAYQAALALRQQHDETVLQLETCAGLARLALTRGDLSAAQDWIAPILDHLQSQTLDGCEEPFRIHLTCYLVLKALQDQRTDPFAQLMYDHLHERAQRISDRELQRSFLEKVPYHREICERAISLQYLTVGDRMPGSISPPTTHHQDKRPNRPRHC